nr:hypothetical protein TetV2_00537 [Oceanusvirus sp.]
MDLSGKRVVIGFGANVIETVVLDSELEQLTVAEGVAVNVASNIRLASIPDVVQEIQIQKTTRRILENSVGAENIQDGSLDPSLVFRDDSDPLDVLRGGFGISNLDDGNLLAGGGTSNAVPVSSVTWTDSNLTVLNEITLSGNTFSVSNDDLGRRSLYLSGADGSNIDLFAPSRVDPEIESVVVTPASGQVTIDVSVLDLPNRARTVHVSYAPSPAAPQTRGQVISEGMGARVYEGSARLTATGLASAAPLDFSVVARDGRGNVSEVFVVSSTPS